MDKGSATEAFNMAKLQAVAIMGAAARMALKEVYADLRLGIKNRSVQTKLSNWKNYYKYNLCLF